MPQPDRSAPRRVGDAGALALAWGLASAALAGDGVHWRLQANVPVMCAILDVDRPADRPAGIAITTTCNAERYQLMLHHETGQARLRAALSTAGPVQISGNAVTITSTRPGYALTVLELSAPVSAKQLSVTLQPT